MKIKRFLAKNMREAIRLVREEQGPDAVILSNRRIDGGVEVVAAVDYDAALMQQAQRVAPVIAEPVAAPPVAAPAPQPAPRRAAAAVPPPAPVTPRPTAPLTPVAAPELQQLRREIGGVRRMMEQQFASLRWKDLHEQQPERMGALRALANIGIDPELVRSILDEMPAQADGERARFLPLGLLSRRIPAVKKDFILDGGIFALVGPTGVGKTTTIAKLAARYAERHGVRDIALVTTDHYRVGAQEQLFTYGRLLGVPVHTAANGEELARTLFRLSDRKLVLVDTAGLSPRDQQLQAQFAELHGSRSPMRVLLTLSATQQAGDLEEIVRRFKPAKPEGLILTKLDEATRIGGALSVAIRHRLPVGYIADGQRVPEDLHLARPDQLVLRAMQLTRQNPALPQDGTLALQYGVLNAGS
ncbi:flagellar biosynthesis protein FlhF [Solimonas sp. SE-A11]|uniref:flagellar biosynthesis protein FlhF n=1 Tax=Solimonas sp. SE-A11 TaxID=3054954 RepID=UPI00259CDBED|nr:flagellar biosynthesis protein FlhF [Solimonas sp. SE-A11]MDM4770774.1 flagellar biosynthesis protein FlhF [Solimonas sp. SE-A11]